MPIIKKWESIMSTTDNSNNSDNEYVTPQARDLVTSSTTVTGPGGDTTKYATSYTSTNNYPVYNGNGYYWTITYDSATQLYQYTARSGSSTGLIVTGSTFTSTTPVNIV